MIKHNTTINDIKRYELRQEKRWAANLGDFGEGQMGSAPHSSRVHVIHIYIYIHVHIYIYIYVHAHIYIYIYIAILVE